METSFDPRLAAPRPDSAPSRTDRADDPSFDAAFAASLMASLMPVTPAIDPPNPSGGGDRGDQADAPRRFDPSARAQERADASRARDADARPGRSNDSDDAAGAAAARPDAANDSRAASEALKQLRPVNAGSESAPHGKQDPGTNGAPGAGAQAQGSGADARHGERGESAMLRAVRRLAREAALGAVSAGTRTTGESAAPTSSVAVAATPGRPASLPGTTPTFPNPATLGTGEAMRAWEARVDGAVRPGEPVALRLEDAEGGSATLRLRVRGEALQATLVTSDSELASKLEQDMGSLQQALRTRGFAQTQLQVAHTGTATAGTGAHDARNQKESTPHHRPNDGDAGREGGELRRETRQRRGEREAES